MNRMTAHALLAVAWIGSVHAAATCKITGGAVAFGAYNPVSASRLDTTGFVDAYCNQDLIVRLTLSVGNGAGASYTGGRKMTRIGSAGTLTYNLYASSSRSQVLGNDAGGSGSIQFSPRRNQTFSQPIYGSIPARQTVAAGSYADIVIATISY